MKRYLIERPVGSVHANVQLEGSKSVSNRLLIMRALCDKPFKIENLSPSDDTQTLQKLLSASENELDVGAAGTTMRFLISYLAIRNGDKILTGSERMKKRPVKILVNALRELGAEINYLGEAGYPPLHIKGKKIKGGKLSIRSDVSSQYISSLLMIGPVLENGLELELTGKISSLPYINMTLGLMRMLGIRCEMIENKITVQPGKYQPREMTAESDWSAASYYYSICALSKNSKIQIGGLLPESLQGDSILTVLYKNFGVESEFKKGILELHNTGMISDPVEFDFSNCPDIAQTAVVTAASLGIKIICTGLHSLKIKETDRTAALQIELKKLGVEFANDGDRWISDGKIQSVKPVIQTYDDHRMAMSFAPLALVTGNVTIEDPDVVNKSYPSFWSDLRSIGFSVSEI